MDEDKIDKLLEAVTEQLQSDEDNLNAAVDIAIDFSKQNSIAPKILLKLSSTFGSNGTYALAYVLAKATASLSEGKMKIHACSKAGAAAHFMGQNEEAEEQYKMAIDLDPNDVCTHFAYGILLNKMGRNDEAEEQYKKALVLDPNDVSAHSAYGILLNKMGRNDEAEEQYKKALVLDPNDISTHSNYGILLNEMGCNDEAEEQYKKVLVLDPKHVNTHHNYGILLKQMGRNDEAEEQYKNALVLDPNDVTTHSTYGILLYEMGRNDEAEEQYKNALVLDPNDVNTHSAYGILLKQIERNDEAEEQYKKALVLDPNDVSTHSNYGVLLNEMGRNVEAEKQYKKALVLDPNDVSTHFNYGVLLNEMGRNVEAEKQYKKALVLNPNDVSTHSNYGVLLNKMGRNDEAEKQFKKALVLDPNDVSTHSNYGILLNKMGRNDEAEKQFKKALVLDPNGANAHGAYGFLLFDIAEDEKALAEIKTASRLFGEKDDNVMEHLVLAWFYERYAEMNYKKGNARKEKKKKSSGYFRKSGEYAELAGDEYIEAGKHAGDKGKGLYLSQGYTLKGRSKIRILELSRWDEKWLRMLNLRRDDYDIAKFELIMDGVKDAAGCYKEAAKHSPKRNAQCDACSNCMLALGSMLDYMLSVIHQRAVPELSEKIKEWNEKLSYAETGGQKNEKGEKFAEALQKLISCIINLEKYKNTTRHEHKKALKDCMTELEEVASNIEGPLQEIIDSSAHQMKKCMLKHKLYTSGAETEPTKDGAISKIAGKVLDKIYDKIATIFVAVLVIIILLVLGSL